MPSNCNTHITIFGQTHADVVVTVTKFGRGGVWEGGSQFDRGTEMYMYMYTSVMNFMYNPFMYKSWYFQEHFFPPQYLALFFANMVNDKSDCSAMLLNYLATNIESVNLLRDFVTIQQQFLICQ